jgi:hypothetical protein
MSLAAAQNPVVATLSASDLGVGDAGGYYVALTPTPGTGQVGPVSTTFSEILALMTVFNGSQASNLYLRGLRLHVTVIGTGGTSLKFTQAIDQGNRFVSGGVALAAVNTNMASPNKSQAQINFGALVTTAASTQRRVIAHTTYVSSVIENVDDVYQFSWGSSTQLEDPASLSNAAAALHNVSYAFAPVTIGPGQTWSLHQWRASITVGITQEAEFLYIEK